MTFKSIFIPMAFEQTAAAITDAALTMARTFNSHVLAHHVRQRYSGYPPVDYFPADGAASAIAMEGHDEATARFARTMRSIFEERCDTNGANIVPISEALKQNGVTASWAEESGNMSFDYSRASRIADLVVAAIPASKERYLEREIFEEMLMESGAPILLTPQAGLAASPRRPLVAWDGSLQASRVVRGSLPLLQHSEETTLLNVGEADAGTPGLDAAKLWLERSGVAVKSHAIGWPKGSVADAILGQRENLDNDIIVMGGYSHSRVREVVLGGVTLHMLRRSDRPLLMIH